MKGRRPGQRESNLVTGRDVEFSNGAKVFPAQRHRGVQQQPVRPSRELEPSVLPARNPRHNGAVFEANNKLGAHRDFAVDPPDQTNQVGSAISTRHEVNDADRPTAGFESRFQNQRIVPIMPRYVSIFRDRRDEPSSVSRIAQERCKTCCAVESGKAQPIDGTVAANERQRFAVSDHGIVFDTIQHKLSLLSAKHNYTFRPGSRSLW